MHVYIYDSYVNQKKYDRVIGKIETRITDLGLNGKIVRLGPINSVYDAINNEIKKGAKTIIVLGNNSILNQAINAITRSTSDFPQAENTPLGFIPIGKKDNSLAEILGIPLEIPACNILSARRIKKLDLGRINDRLFLTEARIETFETSIKVDDKYSVDFSEDGEIIVCNIPSLNSTGKSENFNPYDDKLDFILKQKKQSKTSQTNISFSSLNISNKKSSIIIDDCVSVRTPAVIEIADEKVNLILGKSRKF